MSLSLSKPSEVMSYAVTAFPQNRQLLQSYLYCVGDWGGGEGRRQHKNRAVFSPLAGGHYCLIGSLVRCLLDENRGTLPSLGRIHVKLETIKMPLSK